ncbi:MAG: DUF1850 domain-containing protein [Deltaproteobacteria bacterium]|nr:DUF1850 domain-containing protein [Deltaproteobacteria bacterium]MBW2595818.1 DUF1850 domain-containing protein [Deltaproteobacteria bacterium]MBW2650070.1 DUF1850 domain-containing protein [Deltaproteobacteria bacterium]
MNKKRIIILSSLAALFFFSLIPCHHVLRIEAARKNRPVFVHIVRPNDRFSTSYIHSVELCPVREYFKIDKNFRIVLYETTFSSCNTGLPTTLSGDEKFYNDGTHLRISNMHRILPQLDLWVNEKYDNTLTLGEGRILKLPSLAGDTLLKVTVERLTFLEFLYLKARTFE